jgi:hypothetical protein
MRTLLLRGTEPFLLTDPVPIFLRNRAVLAALRPSALEELAIALDTRAESALALLPARPVSRGLSTTGDIVFGHRTVVSRHLGARNRMQ